LEEDEVLVEVKAAGVCYRDLLDAKGSYPFMSDTVITGHEFSGVVCKVGKNSPFKIGTKVVNQHGGTCGKCTACLNNHRCETSFLFYGTTCDGGYANYVKCKVNSLVPLPDPLTCEQSCFLYCTAAVAWRGLRHHAKLAPGERVLVTGASGGVGLHAIQLAKIAGAYVIAVTSSQKKVQILQDYGADEVVISDRGSFHKKISDKVHVVLDLVGVPTLNSSIRSLRRNGRIVIIGNVSLERFELNPGYFILNELKLYGSSLASRQEIEEVLQMVVEGKLKPVIHATLPLEEFQTAHEMLKSKGVCGRIVLVPPKLVSKL